MGPVVYSGGLEGCVSLDSDSVSRRVGTRPLPPILAEAPTADERARAWL